MKLICAENESTHKACINLGLKKNGTNFPIKQQIFDGCRWLATGYDTQFRVTTVHLEKVLSATWLLPFSRIFYVYEGAQQYGGGD